MIKLIYTILFILTIPSYSFAAYNVWLENSLPKYRQDGEDGTNGSTGALTIQMAKNEFESFQVMLYADGESLSNVDVTVSNLTKGGDTISDIVLYKEWYHYAKSVDVKGVAGDWTDQGSNVWRKNIGSTHYVWGGTPNANYHSQDVGFYFGGTAIYNWHDGPNVASPDAIYEWKYEDPYLYVYATSNPATFYTQIHAPNRKSRVDYASGMYPDALLPKVDRYFGETRNTFPFSITSGKIQGVWVDVGTTTSTPAGTYTGTVTVSAQGKSDITRTINVEVYDFALPSTSTFDTAFVLGSSQATYGHGYGLTAAQNGTQVATDLLHTYMTAGLYHRIGLAPSFGYPYDSNSMIPWNSGTKTLTVASWEPWYSIVKDAYSGTAITSGTYAGAKVKTKFAQTSWPTETRADVATSDKQTAARQFNQLVYDKFDTEGWDPWNTLLYSVTDEPRCDTYKTFRGVSMTTCEAVIEMAQDVNAINTGGNGTFKRVFANSKIRPGLEEFGDYGFYSTNTYTFVCPQWDLTCSTPTGKAARVERSLYTAADVWGYLACDNNACWGTGGQFTDGQIDWSADAVSLYNRMPGLVWAKYEVTGTIYWQTTANNYSLENVGAMGDPYDQIWNFGSNGDGHLLYPGVASATGRTLSATTPVIGGTHDIPIESIRLKHIRDAVEDWEYVQAAKAVVGKNATFVELDKAFTAPETTNAYWNLNTSQSNFTSVRNAIAGLAAGSGGGGSPGKWKIKAITDDE